MSKKFPDTIFCETCQARVGSIFCNLSEEELINISAQKHCNFYLKGQQIFTEGNSPTGLHCVNKGKIKVSQSGFEGKEQIIRLAKEGDILGYRSLVSGEAYTASAIAIEDSKVCIIPKALF
ncbi:MAG: cyclic nucleotide-binding domain-containing protein [Ignavibacteria bacterium]